jgi:hypothetical protein
MWPYPRRCQARCGMSAPPRCGWRTPTGCIIGCKSPDRRRILPAFERPRPAPASFHGISTSTAWRRISSTSLRPRPRGLVRWSRQHAVSASPVLASSPINCAPRRRSAMRWPPGRSATAESVRSTCTHSSPCRRPCLDAAPTIRTRWTGSGHTGAQRSRYAMWPKSPRPCAPQRNQGRRYGPLPSGRPTGRHGGR